MHTLRWDLDRTYLDTEIHSVRGMLRTALQSAEEKKTIPGARELLRSLMDHDETARAIILSGSPTQLREVLEKKLTLDGVRFETLVLKDNLRNLRRGRIKALRGQVGYKLPHLLELRAQERVPCAESLFGDDSEVDALIYVAYAEILEGRLDRKGLLNVLKHGDAYSDQIEHALRGFDALPQARGPGVENLFIHVDRNVPLALFDLLGPRVRPVYSWFQAALQLWDRGRIAPKHVNDVALHCMSADGFGLHGLANLTQDAVRRHFLDGDRALELLGSGQLAPSYAELAISAIKRLGDYRRPQPTLNTPDYVGFLNGLSALPSPR